jgi:hypothetical protein
MFTNNICRRYSLFLAITLIISVNIKYGFVDQHQSVDFESAAATSLNGWKEAGVNEINAPLTTILRPSPEWEHRQPFYDVLVGNSHVSNSTLRRLLKVAQDAPQSSNAKKINLKSDFNKSLYSQVAPTTSVSPLLFGGFIEHMGRVIDGNFGNDGGIWAEKIADRKFFLEVYVKTSLISGDGNVAESGESTKTKSPWLAVVGDQTEVTSSVDNAQSFVRGGRVLSIRFRSTRSKKESMDTTTSPRVSSEGGQGPLWWAEVEQSGIALEAGRSYRGYFWATSASCDSHDDGRNTILEPMKDNSSRTSPRKTRMLPLESDDDSVLLVEVWLRFKVRILWLRFRSRSSFLCFVTSSLR